MNFKKGAAVSTVILIVGLIGCGKNLGEALFHPPVDERVSESLSGSMTAPTPAVPADPNNFSFAVIGDIQMRDEGKTLLARLKADVSTNSIAFFLVLGDLTEDGTTSEYTKAKAALDDVGIPYYATIGNHDLFQAPSVAGWTAWKNTFGRATYSLTVGNAVRVVMFDTASGDIGPVQFQWLESTLSASTPAPFTIVGTHYPIHDGITPTIWRLESVEERYKLTSMLDRFGVYAYVAGHVHGYRAGMAGSVKHFTAGGMYPYDLDFGAHGYLLFTYQAGAMSFRYVEVTP